MLQGGVPDANETTDDTDAPDVRLGSAQFIRRVRAARVLIGKPGRCFASVAATALPKQSWLPSAHKEAIGIFR